MGMGRNMPFMTTLPSFFLVLTNIHTIREQDVLPKKSEGAGKGTTKCADELRVKEMTSIAGSLKRF